MPEPEKPLKIVLVEDSLTQAEMIQTLLLNEWKCNPLVFVDGDSALQFFQNIKGKAEEFPGLVVLDMELPRLNGVEILRMIKSDEALKTIHVIVNTGVPDISYMFETKKWQGVTYLRKGLGQVSLVDTIRKLRGQGVF